MDIIYFNVPADWAFESELYAGPYHLRLLTQTVTSRAAAVNQLSKAVSRSETILMVGGFFGEENLPSAVASAIGFSLQRVGLPGAELSDTYLFPTGSTPFLLDGKIRGAILKSGRQAIIFLDEDRAGRLELTKQQLVPFIFQEQTIAHKDFLPPEHGTPGQSHNIVCVDGSTRPELRSPQEQEQEGASEEEMASALPEQQTVADEVEPENAECGGADKPVPEPQAAAPRSARPNRHTKSPEKIAARRISLADTNKEGRVSADIPESDELNAGDADIVRQLPNLKLSHNTIPMQTAGDAAQPKLSSGQSAAVLPKEAGTRVHNPKTANKNKKLTGASVIQEKPRVMPQSIKMQPIEAYNLHKDDALEAQENDRSLDVTLPDNASAARFGKPLKIAMIILLAALAGVALWLGYKNFAAPENAAVFVDFLK